MWNRFLKNDKGFTGLEAAIVLIAFVVVAAVFSYVMLGAGFFTTQKSQEVVHTGVTQASSSLELSGNVIGIADSATAPTQIQDVDMCLQLTAGGSPVDMAKTLIIVSAPGKAPTELALSPGTYDKTTGYTPGTASGSAFSILQRYNDNHDDILDQGEQFDIKIDLKDITTIAENQEFQIQIEPPQGAAFTIVKTAPAALKGIMVLN